MDAKMMCCNNCGNKLNGEVYAQSVERTSGTTVNDKKGVMYAYCEGEAT